VTSAPRLEIGVVTGAHGVRGGLRVKLHDPGSRALAPGLQLQLVAPGRADIEMTVAHCTEVPGTPGAWRVELDGLVDRELAESLRGRSVVVARADLPRLADDEFYLADAIGLPVRSKPDERELGTIAAVTSNGAQDLFEVRYRDRRGRTSTWLLPVLPSFVRDVTADAVWVELPPGMLPDELDSGED
jgi:16S rRNA processing protein RimM